MKMFYIGAENNTKDDEPATPITRISIHPKHNHIVYCAIGLKNPINLATLKDTLSNSIMLKIPRFSSLLVVDPHNGTELWKKTHVNLDDHIFIHHDDDDDDHGHDDDDAINSYLADMAISPPMSLDKPLWEVHIMHDHKCMIMRVHHGVADGMSLMSLLWSFDNSSTHKVHVDDLAKSYKNNDHLLREKRSFVRKLRLWERLMLIWLNLVFVVKILGRCLWVKDKETVISGIEGVELWPRKVTTAKFQISDMKTIKNVILNATINDVLYGILWCGLTRYLKIQHPQAVQDGTQFTGIFPINVREAAGVQDVATMLSKNSKAPWGNKFAMVPLPITYFERDLDALSYVALAKAIMDRKKQVMEARLSYRITSLIYEWFSTKVGGDIYYNLFKNTSFLLSNMSGPREKISIANNPVTFVRVTSSSQSHAITMHMVSYAGNAELQIQVAKDVIPDPEILATCFQDALNEMKEASLKCIATNLW